MLNVKEAAEQRRSIRKYTGEVVPESDLREILRIASLAPSPWNMQPWRVIVAQDAETKMKLQEAAYGQTQVGSGSAVFVITTDMTDAVNTVDEAIHPGYDADAAAGVKGQILGHFGGYTDDALVQWGRAQGYTFMGYLLLAAQSMGYGTSPMLGFDPAKVREMFGLADHVFIPALVSIGVPAEDGFPHHRHSVDRFAKFV